MSGKKALKAVGIEPAEVIEVCALHGASDVALFGSTVRGTPSPSSDVDLLVTFSLGSTLLDLVELEDHLAKTFGRPFDVVSRDGLSPIIGPKILQEAVAL